MQLLSPHTTLLQPTCPRARGLQREKTWQPEACAPQLESIPHLSKLEKSLCSNKDPAQAKITKQIKKKIYAILGNSVGLLYFAYFQLKGNTYLNILPIQDIYFNAYWSIKFINVINFIFPKKKHYCHQKQIVVFITNTFYYNKKKLHTNKTFILK